MRLILASQSKQRQDILKMIGWKYEVVTSNVEEQSYKENPNEYVEELSRNKAISAVNQISGKAIIVAADSIIYMNGKKYEKPKSKEEAFENIKKMSGNKTYAVTGITIKDLYQNKEITFSDTVEVIFNNICDEDIKWYIENEEKLFTTCGYAILGKAALFLNKVNGDYNTVIGISPSKLYNKFKELGYKLSDFELE